MKVRDRVVSNPKFTPGEWHVKFGNGIYSDKKSIALVTRISVSGEDDEEFEANKHLLVAAKDLFEALEGFLLIDAWVDESIAPKDVVDRARAAIKKARGEQ